MKTKIYFLIAAVSLTSVSCSIVSYHSLRFSEKNDTKNHLSYSVGGTCSVSAITEKNRQKFIDPDYGVMFAPTCTLEPEFHCDITYSWAPPKHKNFRQNFFGAACYYRFFLPDDGASGGGINTTVTGFDADPWDKRYYAALTPGLTIEPFFGKIFLLRARTFFIKLATGTPLTCFTWRKGYYLQLDCSYSNWSDIQEEFKKKWALGISEKITFGTNEEVMSAFSFQVRYAPIKINGGWMNSLTGCLELCI